MKRLFVAVNLPEKIKDRLAEYQEKYKEVPGTWTKKENLHATLVFIGNKSEQEEREIRNIVKKIGEKHVPFVMHFSRIVYGPSQETPRMIWAMGYDQNEFLDLKHDIEKELEQEQQEDESVHLTLLRLNRWQFAKIEPEERPVVDEEIDISFPVNSFELMESRLRREGAEYTILESIPL